MRTAFIVVLLAVLGAGCTSGYASASVAPTSIATSVFAENRDADAAREYATIVHVFTDRNELVNCECMIVLNFLQDGKPPSATESVWFNATRSDFREVRTKATGIVSPLGFIGVLGDSATLCKYSYEATGYNLLTQVVPAGSDIVLEASTNFECNPREN